MYTRRVWTEREGAKVTKSSSKPKERAAHVVSVRLTDEDRELVAHVAETLGVSASSAVRLMLRRNDGGSAAVAIAPTLDALRAELGAAQAAFDKLAVEVQHIGNNVNQVARRVNRDGETGEDDLHELRRIMRPFNAFERAVVRWPDEMLDRLGVPRYDGVGE